MFRLAPVLAVLGCGGPDPIGEWSGVDVWIDYYDDEWVNRLSVGQEKVDADLYRPSESSSEEFPFFERLPMAGTWRRDGSSFAFDLTCDEAFLCGTLTTTMTCTLEEDGAELHCDTRPRLDGVGTSLRWIRKG